MAFNTIQELVKAKRWSDSGPTPFDSSENYIGTQLTEYVSILGQNRDSDALTRSNFESMLEALGGENEDAGVEVHRFGHWACGWYELILIRADSVDKLELARVQLNRLDNYPVLDEYHWSQLESDEASEFIESNMSEFTRTLFKYLEFKNPDVSPRGRRAEMVADLIDRIYRYDMGYSGADQAYVDQEAIRHYLESDGKWDLQQMAGEGNTITRAMIACGLVPECVK